MYNVLSRGGQPINHDVPKFYSLGERAMQRLEKIAEFACSVVVPASRHAHLQPAPKEIAASLSQKQEAAARTELLDELDAQADEAAINASMDQIKISKEQ